MSVTVITCQDQDKIAAGVSPAQIDTIHFHNGFGWFLDATFSAQPLPPARFFSQAIGPSSDSPDPGALTAEQAAQLAEQIDATNDETLETLMRNAVEGREHDDNFQPAIDTVRQLADLARRGAREGGLAVR